MTFAELGYFGILFSLENGAMFHTPANRQEEIQNLSSASDAWPSVGYSTLPNRLLFFSLGERERERERERETGKYRGKREMGKEQKE